MTTVILTAAPTSAAPMTHIAPVCSASTSTGPGLPTIAPSSVTAFGRVAVSAEAVAVFNGALHAEGARTLPQGTTQIGTSATGQLVAYDTRGRVLATRLMSEVRGAAPDTVRTTAGAASWLKGLAGGFARAVVGCVGGAVGYDTILQILERRVSYLAFVKWLAGRVGWGLAVSCAAGAATTVLGW